MKERISPQQLRNLRNSIPITDVIQLYLDIPTKFREGFLRFVCPVCGENNTATNKSTNLARCFTCSKNFNTIEIVMADRQCSFLDAVDFIQNYDARIEKHKLLLEQLTRNIARRN